VSKYLDNVIKEMNNYADMGLPDGEGSMGMGSRAPTGKLKDAFKMQQLKTNQMLRRRNQAEEEEGSMGSDDDMSAQAGVDSMGDEALQGIDGEVDAGMDGEVDAGMDGNVDAGMGTEDDVASLQQFFTDNPNPSDQEISQYAEENGMNLGGMRSAVYALIQSLLPNDSESSTKFNWLGSDTEDDLDADDLDADDHDENTPDDMNDEMNFSVPGDTGERPPKKEFEEHNYGRRAADRRRY